MNKLFSKQLFSPLLLPNTVSFNLNMKKE